MDTGVHFEGGKNPSHSNPKIQNMSDYQPKIVSWLMRLHAYLAC